MMFIASSGGAHASSGAHPSAHVSEPVAHYAPAPRIAPAPRPAFIQEEPVVRPPVFPVHPVPHVVNYHYRDCTEKEKKDKRHHCK